uniref:Uncharacterized protein n=1 Tax=Knipowitschia caucasica TaxID=637954 RepID=A0AAV2JD49_KNICA
MRGASGSRGEEDAREVEHDVRSLRSLVQEGEEWTRGERDESSEDETEGEDACREERSREAREREREPGEKIV